MILVNAGEQPYKGCEGPRQKCFGKPRQQQNAHPVR